MTDLAQTAGPLANALPVPSGRTSKRTPRLVQFACDVGTDVGYWVKPPKSALALQLGAAEKDQVATVLYAWIDKAFAGDGPEIRERLDDADDDLDVDDITMLIRTLIELQTDLPPT